MTQQAVERALGKLLTDENFRERFFENPEAASWEAGLALSPIELEGLSRVPRSALVSLHDELDKRISRPSLDGEGSRAGGGLPATVRAGADRMSGGVSSSARL